jgi:hypothetical protein
MGIIDKFLDLEKPKAPSAEVMTKTEAKRERHFVRTLGNVRTAAEAQRIFNPTIPPMQPKPPTAAMMESGTSSAMGTEGTWGQPERLSGV